MKARPIKLERLRAALHQAVDLVIAALEEHEAETPRKAPAKARRPRTVRPIVQRVPVVVDELTRAHAMKYVRRAGIGK